MKSGSRRSRTQTRARRPNAPSATSAKPQAERKSFFHRLRDYLHEVRQELRKVTWPTREQMIAFSTVTVVTCVILTGVVFALDVAMKELVFWLVERSG